MAQQILKKVDGSFKSFFGLLKKKNKGMYNAKVKLPNYIPKNSFSTLIIGFVRLNEDTFVIIPKFMLGSLKFNILMK